MAYFETWFKVDLALPLVVRNLETILVNDDKQGNLIGVELYKNDTAVSPSGTVTGYIQLADGSTVETTGSISSNRVYITLPAAAYAKIGPATVLVRLAEGNRRTTVLVAQGVVRSSWTEASGDQPDPSFDPSSESISELYSRVEALEGTTSATNISVSGLRTRTDNLETGVSELNTTATELGTQVTSISTNLLNNYMSTSQTTSAIEERVGRIKMGARNYLINSSANVITRDAEPNTDFPPGNMAFEVSNAGNLYCTKESENGFEFELSDGDLAVIAWPDDYEFEYEVGSDGNLYFIGDPDESYYNESDAYFSHWEYDSEAVVSVNGRHNGQNVIQYVSTAADGDVSHLVNDSLIDTFTGESGDSITVSLWYNLTQDQKTAWETGSSEANLLFRIKVQQDANIRYENIVTINRFTSVGWHRTSRTLVLGTDFDGYMPTSDFRFEAIFTGSGTVQFGQVMIEKSSAASDWSPAPEDSDEMIENNWVETKQIASGVLTEVTSINNDLSANYSTTLQTADMISAAVVALENDIATNYSSVTQTAYAIQTAVTEIQSDLEANYSTLEQTASSIQAAVTAINLNLTGNYSTRAQTASDITDAVTAITNNLQTNYSTINQTAASIQAAVTAINQDLTTNYSTITQTANAISLEVGKVTATLQNGSRNLIHNTAFPSVSSTKYYPNINGNTGNGRFLIGSGTVATADHGMKYTLSAAAVPACGFGIGTVASGSLYGLEAGKQYTWSFITDFKLFGGTHVSSATYQFRAIVYYATSLSASNWTTLETVNIQEYSSANFGAAYANKQVALTFTIPSNAVAICLRTNASGGSASEFAAGDYISLKYLKLEEGQYPTAWTAAPEDDVGELHNSAMSLTESAFDVMFDNITAMEVTSTTADFNVKTLSVKGSIVGNVVNTQPGGSAYTYTVSDSNPFIRDLQNWIDQLGKYLTGDITININTYIEGTISIRGFRSRNGKVIINFGTNGALMGSISISECDQVQINGKGDSTMWDISSTTSQACIGADRVAYLEISNMFVNSGETTASGAIGYFVARGTHALITNCNAIGGSYGWLVYNCGVAAIHNCKGGQTSGDYGFSVAAVRSQNGSVAHVYGSTRPYGNCNTVSSSGYISAVGTATVGIGADETPPFISIGSMVTVSPKASSSSTYGGTMISTSSDAGNTSAANMVAYTANYNGFIRTGNKNGGYNYGIWYFGSGSSNLITSVSGLSSVQAACVSVTRRTQQGGNESKTFNLYYYRTGVDNGKSSGETPGDYFKYGSSMNTIATGLTADLGKSVNVTLTGAALTALKNGQLAGFGVGGSSWMEFEPRGCELTLMW